MPRGCRTATLKARLPRFTAAQHLCRCEGEYLPRAACFGKRGYRSRACGCGLTSSSESGRMTTRRAALLGCLNAHFDRLSSPSSVIFGRLARIGRPCYRRCQEQSGLRGLFTEPHGLRRAQSPCYVRHRFDWTRMFYVGQYALGL